MMIFRQPFRGEYPITQKYGELIPGVTYNNVPHTGLDYGCPTGTEVLASADGIVRAAGWDSMGYGFRVIIKHSANRSTLYAHLNTINVSADQEVKQGDMIGESGQSGRTTGPHLHFEARKEWYDYKSHFDPMLLPLISVDDGKCGDSSINGQSPIPISEERLEAGIYKVACDSAFVRRWDNFSKEKLIYKGTLVYVLGPKKSYIGLPFYYIGAGSCMAAHDSYGTTILEPIESEGIYENV